MKNNKREVQGTINGIAEFLKNESYSSILDFNFLNDESTSTDFITEYYNKVNTLDNYHYQMELSIYTWLYELLEYSFCGNYKDKSKIEEYELECEMFCDLNQKNLHKKAFEILEFLNNRQKINPVFDGAKPEKPKIKTFKEFFNADVSDKVIQKIQTEFKDYNGKNMAYLIYLLDVEFNLITYHLESKTDGRKAFVHSLNKTNPKMQFINDCFNYRAYALKNDNWLKHKNFITIREKLQKIQSDK